MKNFLYPLCCLLILSACNDKQETSQTVIETPMAQIDLPENFETIAFDFQKNNLPETCQESNEAVCAIEKTV